MSHDHPNDLPLLYTVIRFINKYFKKEIRNKNGKKLKIKLLFTKRNFTLNILTCVLEGLIKLADHEKALITRF
jgi:hypothetical protein